MKTTIPTYILALPEEEEKYQRLAQELAAFDFIEVNRVEGVRGGLLSDVACRCLTRNEWSVNHKGTLGCFLGHSRIWQLIEKRTEPVCLVLESDAVLQNITALRSIELPAGFEFAFSNARTAYPSESTHGYCFRSLSPVLRFVQQHGRAIGADSYLMTPEGAGKVIKFVEEDSFFTHVDLRLMAYAIDRSWEEEYPVDGKLPGNISSLCRTYSAEHRLVGFSFYPPVTRHAGSPSVRQREDDENATR
jgi:hypothetical protein